MVDEWNVSWTLFSWATDVFQRVSLALEDDRASPSPAPPVFTVSLFQGCSAHLSPAVSNGDGEAGLPAVLEALRGSAGMGLQQLGALLSLFLWVLNGNFTGSNGAALLWQIIPFGEQGSGPISLTCVSGDWANQWIDISQFKQSLPYLIVFLLKRVSRQSRFCNLPSFAYIHPEVNRGMCKHQSPRGHQL